MANIRYAFTPKTVESGKDCEVYLYFDSISDADNSLMLRCHLHDPQFSLDYYLDGVPLSSMKTVDSSWTNSFVSWWNNLPSPSDSNLRVLTLTFPSHLAGGTFVLDFSLQSSGRDSLAPATSIPNLLDVKNGLVSSSNLNSTNCVATTVNGNGFSVSLKIEHPNGTSISSFYWGENEDQKYIVDANTTPYYRASRTAHANEVLYAHIQTEGLYGGTVYVKVGAGSFFALRVKDNVALYKNKTTAFLDSGNQIVCQCDTSSFWPGHKDITPKLSYDSNNIKLTGPQSSIICVMTEPKVKDWEKTSDASCRVDFRPTANYDGSFGFSWFRVGDTNTSNSRILHDCTFLDNLGYHYDEQGNVHQDANQGYSGNFRKDSVMVAKHIWTYSRILLPKLKVAQNYDDPKEVSHGLYLIPQMTILKGKSAQLQLVVESKKDPQEYKFEFSNPEAEKGGYLSVDQKSTSFLMSGMMVKVKCNKEFSKPVNLNVWAYPEKGKEESRQLCGSVQILPNDDMHKRSVNVVLVNVCYKGKANGGNIVALDGSQISKIDESVLQKHYDQVYINIHVEKIQIELDNEDDPIVKKYILDKGKKPMGVYSSCLHNVNNPDWLDTSNGVLYTLLQDLARYAPIKNNRMTYILYTLPRPGKVFSKIFNNYVGLGGVSLVGKNFIVCFSTCQSFVPAHELGHALGLPHTFTGCTSAAKFVYQYATTDNIMDYSHHKGILQQSFFRWQWKMMNVLME